MAILSDKGYKYDVAVSYARIDNEIFANDKWVSTFHEKLKTRLFAIAGRRDIAIWRDTEITDNQYFDFTMKDVFTKVGIFVACLSNSYINSNYCQDEINYFYLTIQQKNDSFGLLINNKSRLFNILLYNIPHEQWPEALAGREGYKFYDDNGMPLGTQTTEFDIKISKLARDIWELLSWMYNQNVRKQVFFANSPRSVEGFREELEDTLKLKARLQPDKELSTNEDNHRNEVEGILSQVCSSIHLFGSNKDDDNENDKFNNSKNYYFISQAEVALKTKKPQLIWYPKNPKNDAKKIQAELDFFSLLENTEITKELAIIPGSPADICREVDKWLDKHLIDADPKNIFWLIDSKPEEILDKNLILDELKILRKPILNYQRSDRIEEALKKAARYIIIVKNSPITSINRIEIIAKLITELQGNCKIGVYIAPGGKVLDEKQKALFIEYIKSGVIVFDANNNGMNSGIKGMAGFIKNL